MENEAYNYMTLSDISPLSPNHMYIDSIDYQADNLLENNNVRISIKKEMKHPDSKYILVFCHVKRKDKEAFQRTMIELQDKMLICGNIDYESYCRKTFEMINAGAKKKSKR